MTVACFTGVMRTVFRIRWAMTVFMLELLVRVLFVSAIFKRPDPVRIAARPTANVEPGIEI